MINDYTGKLLHEARYRDLVNEAKGGWLLKQAGRAESAPGNPNGIRRTLLILWVVITLALGALQFAA